VNNIWVKSESCRFVMFTPMLMTLIIQGIAELQKSLLEVTLQQGYMGEKIPQVWLNFEKRIIT